MAHFVSGFNNRDFQQDGQNPKDDEFSLLNLAAVCWNYMVIQNVRLSEQKIVAPVWSSLYRVIHSYVVNDKIDYLLLFRPDSESFGK